MRNVRYEAHIWINELSSLIPINFAMHPHWKQLNLQLLNWNSRSRVCENTFHTVERMGDALQNNNARKCFSISSSLNHPDNRLIHLCIHSGEERNEWKMISEQIHWWRWNEIMCNMDDIFMWKSTNSDSAQTLFANAALPMASCAYQFKCENRCDVSWYQNGNVINEIDGLQWQINEKFKVWSSSTSFVCTQNTTLVIHPSFYGNENFLISSNICLVETCMYVNLTCKQG